MKKYLLVLVGLCCVLSYALAERPDYPELKKSDANIIGHVLDKKTKEHLPYITIPIHPLSIKRVWYVPHSGGNCRTNNRHKRDQVRRHDRCYLYVHRHIVCHLG